MIRGCLLSCSSVKLATYCPTSWTETTVTLAGTDGIYPNSTIVFPAIIIHFHSTPENKLASWAGDVEVTWTNHGDDLVVANVSGTRCHTGNASIGVAEASATVRFWEWHTIIIWTKGWVRQRVATEHLLIGQHNTIFYLLLHFNGQRFELNLQTIIREFCSNHVVPTFIFVSFDSEVGPLAQLLSEHVTDIIDKPISTLRIPRKFW
jgi:hypothetical protein